MKLPNEEAQKLIRQVLKYLNKERNRIFFREASAAEKHSKKWYVRLFRRQRSLQQVEARTAQQYDKEFGRATLLFRRLNEIVEYGQPVEITLEQYVLAHKIIEDNEN